MNIEEDHLDFFKDIAEIKESFKKFARLLPDHGTLVIDRVTDREFGISEGLTCRVVSFGAVEDADYMPDDFVSDDDGNERFHIHVHGKDMGRISLKVPGEHNALNAAAAYACANIMGVPHDTIVRGLERFTGAQRRFERKGVVNGVTVIDDYAHHPTEIAATLTAAHHMTDGDIWCVFQPHTYTRTKALLEDFATSLIMADHVILVPIYAAREQDIYGVSSETLRDEILKHNIDCVCIDTFEKVKDFLLKNCTKDDVLITMGAGNVVNISDALVSG